MRVLFIGNSHTYFNDMPALFASMCEELAGTKPEVTMLAYSGRTLEWHCEEYFSLRFALLYGNYDFCIIQQRAHPFPEEQETVSWAERIFALCGSAGTKPVVFMPWAQKDEPEMQPVISGICKRLAQDHDALLLPAGDMFQKVRSLYPDIELYWEDGGHASPYGDYLLAAALAVLLTGKNAPDSLPHTGFDFRCVFEGEDGYPHAEEELEKVRTALDPLQTGQLLNVVRSFGLKL